MLTARKQRGAERRKPDVRVNAQVLAPYNSYGDPEFVRAGHYSDRPFTCCYGQPP